MLALCVVSRLGEGQLVALSDLSQNFAGVADRDDVAWDVFGHHTARADRDIVADGYARNNLHAAADPDVVADGDGECVLETQVSPFDVHRMACGVDADVGPDENVVANCDLGLIQDNQINVGVEVLADLDVEAVVEVDRAFDLEPLAALAEHLAQQLRLRRLVCWVDRVVLKQLVLGLVAKILQLWIVIGIVEQPARRWPRACQFFHPTLGNCYGKSP